MFPLTGSSSQGGEVVMPKLSLMCWELFVAMSLVSKHSSKQVTKLQVMLYKNYKTQNHFHLSIATRIHCGR